MDEILLGNDNLVQVDKLTDKADDTFVNSASTIQMTIKDTNGRDIPGTSFPITGAYVAASDGKYQWTVPDTLSVRDAQEVIINIVIDNGANLHYERDIMARVIRPEV